MREDQLKIVVFMLLGVLTIAALWSKRELGTQERTANVPTVTQVSIR